MRRCAQTLAWGVLGIAIVGLIACGADAPRRTPYGAGASGASGANGGTFANPALPNGGMSGGASGESGAPAAGASGSLPDDQCAEALANTSPVTPTVWLVLDGSGSMDEEFGNESRWDALRAALMDDGGVVATLEQNARFGMVLYSGAESEEDEPPPAECVELVVVEPALSNYAAIDAQFPDQELGGWTPTDRALEHVIDNLPVTNAPVLDGKAEPTYVVLATDGAPNDRCAPEDDNGGGGRGQDFDEVTAQRVLDAVTRGATAGVRLLVISLAGGDDELRAHLEEVSDLSGTGRAPFVPATRDELVTMLQEIIGGASCQIALDGSVAVDAACSGTVTLSGTPLVCNDDNGFRLSDERTLQLMGDACNSFLAADSQLYATFPCDVFTPD